MSRPHFSWPYRLIKGVPSSILGVLTNPPPMDPTQYLQLWEGDGSAPPPGVEFHRYLQPAIGSRYLEPVAVGDRPYREGASIEPDGFPGYPFARSTSVGASYVQGGSVGGPAYTLHKDKTQDTSLYSMSPQHVASPPSDVIVVSLTKAGPSPLV
jgi:hypothetical protein